MRRPVPSAPRRAAPLHPVLGFVLAALAFGVVAGAMTVWSLGWPEGIAVGVVAGTVFSALAHRDHRHADPPS